MDMQFDEIELSDREDDPAYQINDFEKNLKLQGYQDASSSSDEELAYAQSNKKRQTQAQHQLQNKNKLKEAHSQKAQNNKGQQQQVQPGSKDPRMAKLQKENKALVIQMETEKMKHRKELEQLIEKQKNQSQQISTPTFTFDSLEKYQLLVGNEKALQEQSTDLKKQMEQSNRKIQDLNIKFDKTKSDLQKALRIIQKEIYGNKSSTLEQVYQDLDRLTSSEESFRGRAQQIEVLKNKLHNAQSQMSQATNMSIDSTSSRSLVTNPPPKQPGEAQANRSIAKVQANKESDAVKQENEKLKVEICTIKSKFSAAKSRKDVVEREIAGVKNEFKQQINTLLAKSDRDDALIKALKIELENAHKQAGQAGPRTVKIDSHVGFLNSEINKLKDTLEEKEAQISELKIKAGDADGDVIMQLAQQAQDVQFLSSENEELKNQVVILQQQNEELERNMNPQKMKSEDAKIIKQLSTQNAKLRTKLDDMEKQQQSKGPKRK